VIFALIVGIPLLYVMACGVKACLERLKGKWGRRKQKRGAMRREEEEEEEEDVAREKLVAQMR